MTVQEAVLDRLRVLSTGDQERVLQYVQLLQGATSQTLAKKPLRLPDQPWLDQSLPVPFDLPRPAGARPIETRQATERLPDPCFFES